MSEDLNTKSLGEKLYEATHGPGLWADLVAASQSYYEKIALAFAASLSHDETANAVITDLRARLQAAEERAGKMLEDLALTAALARELFKRDRLIVEGDKLVFTGPWARVGSVSVSDILDRADAALKTEGA